MADTWIWLPEKQYPDHQTTRFDALSDGGVESFTVAEFEKTYEFDKEIMSVQVRFSGDTEVQLFCNDNLLATGPAPVGGDFLGNGSARAWYYADAVTFAPGGKTLGFFARVKMCPTRICEYSKGHGGFMLWAEVTFADGSNREVSTDATWMVRKNGAYTAPRTYDGRIVPDAYVSAEVIPDIWEATVAPIPVRTEKEVTAGTIYLAPGEEVTRELPLDMIYAGYLHLTAESDETVEATLFLREIAENASQGESVVLKGKDSYRSFHLDSAGNILVTLKNNAKTPSTVTVGFITTCYPVEAEAETVTSDEGLNRILRVCKHTLQYCRQLHHLDSPRHCEPLACTGDYYIEALMTAFSFGDMRLAEFDVERTAQLLRHNDGRMFHTTYSLIWVRMLYDVYRMGGNFALLQGCRDALDLLMARFARYVGENGLIETPPDYMFVDWIYIDEISMHHPPKALGQTVLNMFYFMALNYAEKVYAVLGEETVALECAKKAAALQNAVNTLLYDEEKEMYFEGLNTPIDESQVYQWLPQNVEKRYYLKHSNIMAAYTSICGEERSRKLIEKVVTEEIPGDVQPYFLHYLLEAISDHGLREKYTLQVINRWKQPVEECDKGLVEGFVAPEPTYSFDHSHAWGGTPLYSLPKALLGLSIEEAGYQKIVLRPSLLGLASAKVELLTPYGMVTCVLKEGCAPQITAPAEVQVEIL